MKPRAHSGCLYQGHSDNSTGAESPASTNSLTPYLIVISPCFGYMTWKLICWGINEDDIFIRLQLSAKTFGRVCSERDRMKIIRWITLKPLLLQYRYGLKLNIYSHTQVFRTDVKSILNWWRRSSICNKGGKARAYCWRIKEYLASS